MHVNADRDAKRDLKFKQFHEIQALHDTGGMTIAKACEDIGLPYAVFRQYKSAVRPQWFAQLEAASQ